jgi:hypothetical protein
MLVMTSASTFQAPLPTRCHEAAKGVIVDQPDPFVAPSPSHRVGDAPTRSRVVLRGLVVGVEVVPWGGGPVLEVTISDASGAMRLAFLGRHSIGGVEPGRVLTAAGTVGRRDGRPLLINPLYWLHAALEEGPHA